MPSRSSKEQKSNLRSDSRTKTSSLYSAQSHDNRSASTGGSVSGSGSSGGGSALYGGYTPPPNPDGTERDPFGSRAYDSDDSEEDGSAQMRKYHEGEAQYHAKVAADRKLARANARHIAADAGYGPTGSSSAGASSRSSAEGTELGSRSRSSGRNKPRKTVKFKPEVSPPPVPDPVLPMRCRQDRSVVDGWHAELVSLLPGMVASEGEAKFPMCSPGGQREPLPGSRDSVLYCA